MKHITLYNKYNIQVSDKVLSFFDPDYVFIPFYNRQLIKKQEDGILINEIIMNNKPMIRSCVSGKIIGVKKFNNNSYLVVQNNYKEKKCKIANNFRKYTIDNILNCIEYFGNEILLDKLKQNNKFDNIIINTVNDELYCLNNIIIFNNNIKDILELIDSLRLIYKNNKCNIVIKENDTSLIEESLNIIGTFPNINIVLIKNEYLLGKERFLLEYLNLNKDKTLYLDIDDIMFIISATKYKKISDTKMITICGDAINKGITINTKKYVLVNDILSKYIKIIDNNYSVIVNSLLTGYDSNINNLVITDDINTIYIMKKNNLKSYECTKCGKCIDICPLNINIFNRKSIKRCINCGLCNYICPSRINLKKYIEERK